MYMHVHVHVHLQTFEAQSVTTNILLGDTDTN